MMIRVLAVAVALLAQSCLGPCTAVGCADAVTFQLGTAVQQFGVNEPVTVKACVGATCVSEVVTRHAGEDFFGGPSFTVGTDGTLRWALTSTISPGAQTVTLQLTKSGTVVLDQTRDGVAFTESFPNGPACGPTCRSASLTL